MQGEHIETDPDRQSHAVAPPVAEATCQPGLRGSLSSSASSTAGLSPSAFLGCELSSPESSAMRSAGGARPRSRSPGSNGSSSSRSVGSSEGSGTENPAGSRPSNNPEPL